MIGISRANAEGNQCKMYGSCACAESHNVWRAEIFLKSMFEFINIWTKRNNPF